MIPIRRYLSDEEDACDILLMQGRAMAKAVASKDDPSRGKGREGMSCVTGNE